MSLDLNTNGYIKVAGTNVFQLPGAGVLNPNQPSFHAINNSSVSQGAVTIFSTKTYDISNGYNTTTGLFTCPVAGMYHFIATYLVSYTTVGDFGACFRKNGVNTHAATGGCQIVYHPQASTFKTQAIQSILYMAVNDTMGVYVERTTAAIRTDSGYAHFSGYLIG